MGSIKPMQKKSTRDNLLGGASGLKPKANLWQSVNKMSK